jgi:hypothetical protein
VSFLVFLIFFIQSIFADTTRCPPSVLLAIECPDSARNFQLLKHIGKYSQPKLDFDASKNVVVCSYVSNEWISKYKYLENNEQKVVSATTPQDLSGIVRVISDRGFNIDNFSGNLNPYSVVTFKQKNSKFVLDQVFLYTGLESTFEKDNFAVNTLDKRKISTIIINDRYLKTEDAAADTFQTGSNCLVTVK